MPNDSAFPKSLMAAALSAAFPGMAVAQTAARIDFATGNVTASTADGRSRALTRGSDLQVGETVNTQQGRAQMRFTDGAFVSLQPQTEFKIENYVFEGRGSPKESAVMNLLKGGMRTITGLIGRTNRDGYRLQTATATVGIRGTGYSVSYDAGGSVTIFVAEGATTVTNLTGTAVIPGGRGVTVNDQNSQPTPSDEKPFLPPSGSGNTNIAGPQNPVQDALPQLPGAAALLTGTIDNKDPNLSNIAWAYNAGFEGSVNMRVTAFAAQTAVLDSVGRLTGYTGSPSSFEGTESSGSAQLSLAGNDGVIAWGRWIGGSTGQGKDLANNGPLHYVVGVPVTNMPTTGTATYAMLGATASCYSGCGSAAVTGSTLTVNFGPSNVSGSMALGMQINGATTNFSASLYGYTSSANFTANACNGGYSLYSQGFFAGPAASRAGMAYHVSGTVGEGPSSTNIGGVVAYRKQ